MNAVDASLPSHAYGASAWPRFMPLGDAALTVEFGDAILPEINAQVIALDLALAASELPGIVEAAPSYRSLLVCYEPGEISFATLVAALRLLLTRTEQPSPPPPRRWRVPVLYGGPSLTDLPGIAQQLGLSTEEVVALHASGEYSIFFVGFAPGVPNLAGLPPALHMPRRPMPRPKIPAGSVVMAGAQASVVSIPVPSGWHILGHAPIRPFDPARSEPFLFRPGDLVRFCPVDRGEYDRLVAGLDAGEQPLVAEAA